MPTITQLPVNIGVTPTNLCKLDDTGGTMLLLGAALILAHLLFRVREE